MVFRQHLFICDKKDPFMSNVGDPGPHCEGVCSVVVTNVTNVTNVS